MRPWIFISIFMNLFACQSKQDNVSNEQELVVVEKQPFMFDADQTNEIHSELVETSFSKDALFGRFFNNRAEYYVVEQPGYILHGKSVDKIIFYYIDDELVQTKYFLADEITDQLIKEHGKFSIKGFDFVNRNLISEIPIVLRENGQLHLNPAIDNYELKWKLGDEKEILFRVNRNESVMIYVERSPEYILKYKEVELASR